MRPDRGPATSSMRSRRPRAIKLHPWNFAGPHARGHKDIYAVLRIRGPLSIIEGMEWVRPSRSEEHTSELQSPCNLVCRLLLEKKKKHDRHPDHQRANTSQRQPT